MKKLNIELEMRDDVYEAFQELYEIVHAKYGVTDIDQFVSIMIRNHIFNDLEFQNSVTDET